MNMYTLSYVNDFTSVFFHACIYIYTHTHTHTHTLARTCTREHMHVHTIFRTYVQSKLVM